MDEDFVRPPIPSKTGILIDDENDDFEEFKKSILDNKSIDKEMKQILIKSRLDVIKKFDERSKFNIEKGFRSEKISILTVRLKNNQYNKINSTQKKFVIDQIDKWIDGIIKTIKLDSEVLYEIIELISEIKLIRTEFNDQEIKKIFEPKNPDDYSCFIDTMEIIKLQSIKEEQERINKKNEQKLLEEEAKKKYQEEQEKKNQLIKIRKDLIDVIIINLNKLSSFDNNIKLLKEAVMMPINNYIGLDSDYIEISNGETFIELIKFINSIRILKDIKDKILNLIKNSSI